MAEQQLTYSTVTPNHVSTTIHPVFDILAAVHDEKETVVVVTFGGVRTFHHFVIQSIQSNKQLGLSRVTAAWLSPDGKKMIICDGGVLTEFLWQRRGWREDKSHMFSETFIITTMDMAKNCNLVVGGESGHVVFDGLLLEETLEYNAHDGAVEDVKLFEHPLHHVELILSKGLDDEALNIFHVASDKLHPLQSIYGVSLARFVVNFKHILVLNTNNQLEMWYMCSQGCSDIFSGPRRFEPHDMLHDMPHDKCSWISDLKVDQDILVTINSEDQVVQYDAKGNVCRLKVPTSGPISIVRAFGKTVVGTSDGEIFVA